MSFLREEGVLDLRNRLLDLEADPALFELTVRALAEGNSIQGTARIVPDRQGNGLRVVDSGRPPMSLGGFASLAGAGGDRVSTG